MKVTGTLAQWSRASNRRRSIEIAVRGVPWSTALAALTTVAWLRGGTVASAGVAGAALLVLAAAAWRAHRRAWLAPGSTARGLDHRHRTHDLLQSAVAIEGGAGAVTPMEQVVIARAGALLPSIAADAVAPVRLRVSPGGALTALAAVALVFLIGAHPDLEARSTTSAGAATDAAQLADAQRIAEAIAQDPHAPAAARAAAARASAALRRAAKASSAASALAEMSEASRLLDGAARKLAERAAPDAKAVAAMTSTQLADALAQAAADGDEQKVAALARDALRRATRSSTDAATLASALAAAARTGAPAPSTPGAAAQQAEAQRRLAKLAAAAARLAAGDLPGARAALSDLHQLARGADHSADPRLAQLDAARASLASMRAATRSAMNGGEPHRPTRERVGAEPGPDTPTPGAASAPMPGPPSSAPPGGMTAGGLPGGAGGTPMPGDPSGGRGPTPGPSSDVLGVRPGGAAGSSGSHGGGRPPTDSGAPSSFTAEQVTAAPDVTPEGAIRAIEQRSIAEHEPVAFGPVREHYAAIAEAAIRRDDIPLTRRDYIQRYFAALRSQETP